MSIGAHSARLERELGVVDYSVYRSILAPVISTWRGYWTTFDEAIGPDPGIALTSGEVASWTDQRSGFVLSAPGAAQRPAYAADGTNFAGHSVVQTAITGVKALVGDFGSDLFATGERPYSLVLFRGSAALAANTVPFTLSGTAGADRNQYYFWFQSNQNMTAREITETVTDGTYSQNVTLISSGLRSGTTPRIRSLKTGSDTTATGGVSNNVLAGSVRRMTVGINQNGTTDPANANWAEILLFNNYPGDAIERRIVSAMRRKWGF